MPAIVHADEIETEPTTNRATTVTRQWALLAIADHGWKPDDQTATYHGQPVESGTSFYEMLGNQPTYTVKDLRDWLGY